MNKTDILIQKDQELKRLNDQILTLTEKIANLQISIGSKDEVLKSKVHELERELELAKDQQKVIVGSTEQITEKYCSNCGYTGNTTSSYCPHCGQFLSKRTKSGKPIYKNLDSELANIRKDVEKQTKKSIASLEDLQLDLEIKIETLENEAKRKDKRHSNEIEDLQSKNLDRINKYKEEIQELREEMNKIKKNKTEAELEAKRLEEVEKLKAANELLVTKLAEAEKLGFWRKLFRKLFVERAARKEAIIEVLKANELTNKLENTRNSYWRRLKGYVYTYTNYDGIDVKCSND